MRCQCINFARDTRAGKILKLDTPMPSWMSSETSPIPMKQTRGMAVPLGGLMTLAAGLLSLLNGIQGIVFGGWFQFGLDPGFSRFEACGVICILFGIVGVAGGISALRGWRLSLALAGAVLGMMGGGLVGFWLGLGALIVFAFSNEDF